MFHYLKTHEMTEMMKNQGGINNDANFPSKTANSFTLPVKEKVLKGLLNMDLV